MSANFLEIIVSLCIIALMLLGLDVVQLTSLHEVKSAYDYAVAQRQIKNMAEYLSQNRSDIRAIVSEWNKQNHSVLPTGCGVIEGDNQHDKISIFWGDQHRSECVRNQLGLSGCLQLVISK